MNESGMKNEDLNILFTFFVPSGGVETLNRQRYYALNPKGVKCHFLYTQSGTGLQNKINAPIYIESNDSRIQSIIGNGNFDAIVVGSDLLMLQKIRNWGYKGPLIYEVQGLGFNKEYAENFLKKHAIPFLNPYCDAILYPQTPHLMKAFETFFPLKKKFCFNNCFDMTQFHYMNLPKYNNPVVGWVGRLEDNKNWRDFLRIGAQLIAKFPNIELWLFEDNTLATPESRREFEMEINRLNLTGKLTVFANQPHSKMAEHFSRIGDSGGFLCSTSKVEGFGYAVLEAMVCKCPVLSTDSDGVRNFVIHNYTGKFFELGNIKQAIEQADSLITNSKMRESIINNAYLHVQTHFSPEKYAINFMSMIDRLRES
jgi:glycosyltransferase involved in cell wall biosynthesis